LMSFRKLKEEYPDYKGGLLLIDEADAGLFPTAQVNLLKMLDRECKNLNLQVVMTSHSPVLIEYAFEQSRQFRKRYKTVYLSNTYGDVQVMQDWSWAQISADINTKTIAAASGASLPSVNVYFEDKEAADFFATLMIRQPIKKFTTPMSEITLGCSNYLQLIQKGIPEFAERSIVCLDADQTEKIKGKNFKTVVLLPGALPPDQLIFEHLYNLHPGHEFWKNGMQFTRDVFTNSAREVINEFVISGKCLYGVAEVISDTHAYTGFLGYCKDDSVLSNSHALRCARIRIISRKSRGLDEREAHEVGNVTLGKSLDRVIVCALDFGRIEKLIQVVRVGDEVTLTLFVNFGVVHQLLAGQKLGNGQRGFRIVIPVASCGLNSTVTVHEAAFADIVHIDSRSASVTTVGRTEDRRDNHVVNGSIE